MAIGSPALKAFLVETPFFGGLSGGSLDLLIEMLAERRFEAGAITTIRPSAVEWHTDMEPLLEVFMFDAVIPGPRSGTRNPGPPSSAK